MAKSQKQSQSRALKVRGLFPPELVKWITSPDSEINEEVERALQRVLQDRKRRTQVFLTALARKHIERIIFLFGKIPLIENELLTAERIRAMRTGDLTRLLAVVGGHVSEASEFLRAFVSVGDLQSEIPSPPPVIPDGEKEIPAEDVTQEDVDAAKTMSTETRQCLARILVKVQHAVDVANKEAEQRALPDPGNSEKK